MNDDTISRQAAINRFCELLDTTEENPVTCIRQVLDDLPSAQPKSCEDTIDALDESIKHFDDMAEECRRNANIERNDYMDMRDDVAEYRQLSIWLAELKWLRERFQSQPEYYDYSDIEPLWESFAEENDINLTETAKQLKDAMWCGYRKGKTDAQPEPTTEIQEILNYLDTILHPIVSPDNWNVYAELHDMVSQLPSAEPEQRWIPCDERLPEEYGEYRITWSTTHASKKRFIGDAEYEITGVWDAEQGRFKGEWLLDDYIKNYPDVEVLAWKPLEEPYREEGDE